MRLNKPPAGAAAAARSLSLVLLATQNVASALLVQLSRSSREHGGYSPSAAVLVGEAFKLAVSFAVLVAGGDSPSKVVRTLRAVSWSDRLRIAVPALIYSVQNNLVFVSLSRIPSALFQVFSQLKVLTTALFSVVLLGRALRRVQWIALVVLVCGVALAQLSQKRCPAADAAADDDDATAADAAVGVGAVCLLTVLSGFAGVYQERIVKRSSQYPLNYFNIQLALASIVTNGGAAVSGAPLLRGFTWLTWVIVVVQGSGGLLVSLVVRDWSALAKSYVVAAAIFATGVVSHFFMPQGFELNAVFAIGAALCSCSVVLYNDDPQPKPVAAS